MEEVSDHERIGGWSGYLARRYQQGVAFPSGIVIHNYPRLALATWRKGARGIQVARPRAAMALFYYSLVPEEVRSPQWTEMVCDLSTDVV